MVVDFSEVYKRIEDLAEGNLDWFEKIKLAVTGLNNLLDSLESSINSGMMSNIKDVPVVGSAVSGGVDFLSKLKQQILEPFSDFVYESTGMTAEMVARKMNELLGEYLIKPEQGVTAPSITVGEGSISWENDIADSLYYRSGQNYAEWFFRLGGDYSLGADLGLDLGFPGLGLETEGGLNLSLAWTLEFGFGVSENGGFYFIFEEGNELNVVANAIFDNAQILGKMARLGVGLMFGSDDVVALILV